ncbi:translation initiation factor IF-2-like [Alligator mississippiensis]|uniref:Translation initiation factor IF-2-like n=1 Tax=Alligator mississippiensis TaxID=8496 RepID=A0A151N7R7_ALLMI|nr:translation initiation factor IF-2-like [Alligator mississippiensis]
MALLAKHFWFTFSALSGELSLRSTLVHSGHASSDSLQSDTNLMHHLEPHPLFKRASNWNKVIPNRPALAKIVVLGSVCIILALLIGLGLWCFYFIQMRKIGALTFGVGALAKKLPFLKQAQGAKPWSWGAGSDVRGRAIGKIKKFGYAAFKHRRKKKRSSSGEKEERPHKKRKVNVEKKKKLPKESQAKVEKEKPLEEGKENGEEHPKERKAKVEKKQKPRKKRKENGEELPKERKVKVEKKKKPLEKRKEKGEELATEHPPEESKEKVVKTVRVARKQGKQKKLEKMKKARPKQPRKRKSSRRKRR